MRSRNLGQVGVLLALLVLAAGCLGVLTGSEPFVATADEVGVSDATVSETDFQHAESESAWLNETVEAGGQEREIRIKNEVSSYEIEPTVGTDGSIQFGLFTVFSTPRASIAGQAMNPIGRLSHRQLIEEVAADSGNLQDISEEDTREATVLGEETEITRFSAIAELSGQEVPVYVEVTRVEDGDDFVIAVGVYPQESEDAGSQVETLFGGIEH